MDPVEEAEGDLFMGDPDLEEDEDGGGGNSSGGGGGNSGDCGATAPPGCHFGLALTAGGDWGAPSLDASAEGATFPGN